MDGPPESDAESKFPVIEQQQDYVSVEAAADDGGTSADANKSARTNAEATSTANQAAQPLPPHGYPLDHPYNEDGLKFMLAERYPNSPYDEIDKLGVDCNAVQGWLHSPLMPKSVLLSLHNRAGKLQISDDRLAVTCEREHCMVRATHFVNRGSWYFECTIEKMREGAATRIGWGQAFGYKFGYSWGSPMGSKFHNANGLRYTGAYGEGDTLGFLITLPVRQEEDYLPPILKDSRFLKIKSHYYHCCDVYNSKKCLEDLRELPESKIEFFRNGESQGVPYTNLYAGSYFPTFALCQDATIRANFGPNFKYAKVLQKYNAKGMHMRVDELIEEQRTSEELFFA